MTDLEAVLARRHDNGADFWGTADGGLGVGAPFSTLESLLILHELGVPGRPEDREVLDRAVETLLDHWDSRVPMGPCGFGIGSLFMQVEYPFFRYNIFSYTYILSFYKRAAGDARFRAALERLESELDEHGRLVVERPNRKLATLELRAKGRPSELATGRYREIRANLGKG